VAFTEWTIDGHIRHPSFQRMREDKNARTVKQEKPVPLKKASVKKTDAELVLRGVTITHPDRVISKNGHITKGELAKYYAAVAPLMLPLQP
jgi:bifunctional non-homologous end joining protein LigD